MQEDLAVHQDKWNMLEHGIWYLRLSHMLEIILSSNKQFPNNSDSTTGCTQNMWQNFIWNALELYARSLRMVAWKGEKKRWTGILVGSFWTYKETISTLIWAYVSPMERMTKDFQYLEKEIREGSQNLKRR